MKTDYRWEIPEKVRVRLGTISYGRQRAIFEDGHLLLILHRAPNPKEAKRESIVFWRKPDGEWWCNGEKDGLQRLKRTVSGYDAQCVQLESDYTDSNNSDKLFLLIEKILPLLRSSSHVYEALQSAREKVPLDSDLIDLRDKAYEINRSLDLLYSASKNALDFRIAKTAEQDAIAARQSLNAQNKLNLLAATFLPLTALAAVFGMNLPNGLNQTEPYLFWIIFVFGLLSGFLLRHMVIPKSSQEKL